MDRKFDHFVGEIRPFAGTVPAGWVPCDGGLVDFAEADVLGSLIYNRFKPSHSDGRFHLPDLRGRIAIGAGRHDPTHPGYAIGQKGGQERVALSEKQMPVHTHQAFAAADAVAGAKPEGRFWATEDSGGYAPPEPNPQGLHENSIGFEGHSVPHENRMPYLALDFRIALRGEDPRGKGPSGALGDIVLLPYEIPSGPAAACWLPCDGRTLPIAENQALFTLLGGSFPRGPTFGGDGKRTFALPDLRARVPLGADAKAGPEWPIGRSGGKEAHALTYDQLPRHTHPAYYGAGGNSVLVPGPKNSWGGSFAAFGDSGNVPMNGNALGEAGGGEAHDNMQPFLALTYYICVNGHFPMMGDPKA